MPTSLRPPPRRVFDRDAADVARDLLGLCLVRRGDDATPTFVGRIVEVEAYLGPDDRASHSARGRTARNAAMFGPPGHAYVYLIYGMHHCLNVVTGPVGHGAAVLIRAVEPLGTGPSSPPPPGPTSGPGRLCRSLGIDRSFDGLDLLDPAAPLGLAAPQRRERPEIAAGPRVGVAYAGEWAARPLRFWIAGNPFVSRPSGPAMTRPAADG